MEKTLSYAVKQLEQGEDALHFVWEDGVRSTFHYVWLLDNQPACFSPSNGARVTDWRVLPLDVRPEAVELGESLVVEWPDGARSEYALGWLRRHAYGPDEVPAPPRRPRCLWDVPEMTRRLVIHDHDAVQADDRALQRLLQTVRDFGFAFVEGVPGRVGAVADFVSRFGFVRETRFGRVYEIKWQPKSGHLSYMNSNLALHTGNPYRAVPPAFVILHFLENSVRGGETTVVDGFRVVDDLRRADPAAFEVLATTPIAFWYPFEDAELRHRAPIIRTDLDGEVVQIRANPPSTAPFQVPADRMLAFYAAYHKLSAMLSDERYRFVHKLTGGHIALYDNYRVLHGRLGFDEGAGGRHLEGCYAESGHAWSLLDALNGRLGPVD